MTHNQTKRVAIEPDRLNYMIKTGHGKEIPRDKLGKNSKHRTKWTLVELAQITGLNYQRISKISRGTGGKEQNYSTAAALAAALDVDIEYLTGQQDVPRMTPQRQQEQERRETVRRITETISFISRYGIRVELDNPQAPTKYNAYDLEDRLIKHNADIEELLFLVEMIHNLFRTGSDIISLFFVTPYLWEE